MKPVVTAAFAVGAFCAAFAIVVLWPNGQRKTDAVARIEAAAPDPDTVARNARTAEDTSVSGRNAYRARLEHAFLEAGIDVEVSVRSKGYKDMPTFDVPFPSLQFFGPFSRVSVYKVAGSLNKFDDARKFGFKTVEFVSNLGEGTWYFDVRKPSPTCDRGLCF